MLSLDEVAVFTRVVDDGSFTAAAVSLGLPKSTVSRKVSALEERLGARLLQRTTRKLKLTDTGQAFYERCAGPLADLEEAARRVTELSDQPQGVLKITSVVEVGQAILGPLTAKFRMACPDVSVDLTLTERNVDLVEEGFDLAIRARSGPLPDSSLIARRLLTARPALVAAKSYLDARGRPQLPSELAEHDALVHRLTQPQHRWRLRHDDDGREAEVEVRPVLVSNLFGPLISAARAGAGIAMAMPFADATDDSEVGLERVLPEWSGPAGTIYALYPSSRHLAPRVRAYLDFLSAELAAQGLVA